MGNEVRTSEGEKRQKNKQRGEKAEEEEGKNKNVKRRGEENGSERS